MKGLFYKEWIQSKSALIFLLAVNTCLYMGSVLLYGSLKNNLDFIIGMSTIICYLTFFLINAISGEIFKYDESRLWNCFVASTPAAAKGHIETKYLFVFLVCLLNLALCFLTDVLAKLASGSTETVLAEFGIYFFYYRLLMFAIEIPFVVRFGSEKGGLIKSVAAAFVICLIGVWFLFGDISFLLKGDIIQALEDFLAQEKVLWTMAIFPWVALAAYYVSYRISLKLYEKGVESYE